MSLKDLLPPGAFDEIAADAHAKDIEEPTKTDAGVIMVQCPTCKKKIAYDVHNQYRPFCSKRCQLIDLGAWANEEMVIPGRKVNEDEDADLLEDPNLPKRNIPHN